MKTVLITLALVAAITAPAAAQSTATSSAVKVDSKVSASLASSVKVSGDSAIALARRNVPDGEVSSAKLEMEDGSLVYTIKLLQKNKGASQFRVDAMSGAILKDTKLGGIKAIIEHQNENKKLLDAKRDSAKSKP